MSKGEYTLSEEQLGLLNNGKSVVINGPFYLEAVAINPPCELFGHDWGFPRFEAPDSATIERRCNDCGEIQSAEINMGDFNWE